MGKSMVQSERANAGVAYALWCLCFFGICGGQRFYVGKVGSGLLYLLTLGGLGVGQLLDLILIPGMVNWRNAYLLGLQTSGQMTQNVTVNIGEIPQAKAPANEQLTASKSNMHRLLKAAQEHGGTLSAAQAAIYTDLEPDDINALLQQALKLDYAEVYNDPQSGSIRYRFDV